MFNIADRMYDDYRNYGDINVSKYASEILDCA
jgi:hypothetical protein